MNCIRHKTTELIDGVCPECGWSNLPAPKPAAKERATRVSKPNKRNR